MDIEELADPRLVLFAMYGTFVVVLIFCSGLRLGCEGRCAFFSAPVSSDASNHERSFGIMYEFLSADRRKEIDGLRLDIFSRLLEKFTLTLDKEHMVNQARSDDDKSEISTVAKNDIEDGLEHALKERRAEEAPDKCESSTMGNKDIEDGLNCDPGANGLVYTDSEEVSKYTHISIPCPGLGVDGNSIDSDDGTQNGSNQEREVPIFCAICLSEYEISDEICWSSNSNCTHVFHKECILQWLAAMGKRKSRLQRFPDTPSEKKLLNYDLDCPCCRQAFIIKNSDKKKPPHHIHHP